MLTSRRSERLKEKPVKMPIETIIATRTEALNETSSEAPKRKRGRPRKKDNDMPFDTFEMMWKQVETETERALHTIQAREEYENNIKASLDELLTCQTPPQRTSTKFSVNEMSDVKKRPQKEAAKRPRLEAQPLPFVLRSRKYDIQKPKFETPPVELPE